MRTLFCIPVLLLAIAAGPTSAIQDPSVEHPSEHAASVIVANNEIIISPGAPLGEIIDKLAPLTGRSVYMPKEVASKITSIRINLSSPLRAPRNTAEDLLDSLLFSNEFVFVPPNKAEGSHWRLCDLKGPDRMNIRTQAVFIEVNDVERNSTKPRLFCVVVPLEHANAREISASLRPFFPDNQLETVANIGNSNCLLIYGFGPTVAMLVRLVRKVDSESAESATAAAERKAAEKLAYEKSIQGLEDRIVALEKEMANVKKAAGGGVK